MADERLYRESIVKIYSSDIAITCNVQSICEHCGADIIDHEWVDLDEIGYITNCSRKPNEPKYMETLDESERTDN